MQVDIFIRERNGTREIRIPWLPDAITYSLGEVSTAVYKILDRGDVAQPTGSALAHCSWESVWPGRYRTDRSLQRGAWQDPKNYHNILSDWHKKGTPLNVMVVGYPINKNMYLKSYESQMAGGFGDIAYSVEFEEDREITISNKVHTTTRPSSNLKTTSYTIKKGDTLWEIAKKCCNDGSKWSLIYATNKSIIENTAKKHGKKSSDNGWWIYPGVTIKIPQ